MPSDFAEQFAEISKRLSGVESSAILIMILAILVGLLFVSFVVMRSQGLQIKSVIDTNNIIIKSSEDRHQRDLERFEERLASAEKRADEKDRLNSALQRERSELIRKHEVEIRKLRKEIDEALTKLKSREIEFSEVLSQKKNLQSEVLDLSNEINQLKEERDNLRQRYFDQINRLKAVSDQIELDDKAHAKELDIMNRIIKKMEMQINQLKEENKNDSNPS